MIYLASPYSSSPILNYRLALEATAYLVSQGHIIYSPIVHCHPLHLAAELPSDFAFWSRHNFGILRKATEMWVLDMPGWGHSTGVRTEILFALTAHIPLAIVETETYSITRPPLPYWEAVVHESGRLV